MRRTRIAHVIFPRPSLLRPVPEFCWDAVRALGRTPDLDVDVLMPVPVRSLRRAQGIVRDLRGARRWPAGLDERLDALLPKPTLIPYVPLPRRSTESATAALANHLLWRPRAGRPKVLHGSFLDEGGFAAAMAARVLGVPSIVVAHGSDVRSALGDDPGIGRRERVLRTLRDSSRVLAVSHELAGQLARLGTTAEVFRYSASGEDFPVARKRPVAESILFVGRLTKAKGVDLLLNAFGGLSKRRPNAQLILVGPDPQDIDISGVCATHGITDRVQVVGEVVREALPQIYADASIVALPSRSEGLPCTLVEALLVGRPVVATRVGGITELVDHRVGGLVPTGHVDALEAALDDVLTRARKGAFVPGQLRARALDMSWERTGERLANLTRQLLGEALAR